MNKTKADRTELKEYTDIIENFNHKIRHITVFTSELANMLMPEKESGKFSTSKELQDSIKKRNELIN